MSDDNTVIDFGARAAQAQRIPRVLPSSGVLPASDHRK